MTVQVRILPGGIERVEREIVAPWLRDEILEPARSIAVREANVDTGFNRSTIQARVETEPRVVGYLEATGSYALWQETEPGDRIPGVGVRQRSGGKPYLRPGVYEALRRYAR